MSVSKTVRERGEILDEIMAYHRARLPKEMRELPIEDLRAYAAVAPPPLDFLEALRRPGVSLIAECKKASPSKGLMVASYDAQSLAQTYIRGGASAISVLTDGKHFQGKLQDLRDVKEVSLAMRGRKSGGSVPVLRKDFIFDPYQVYEARVAGADAVLLIVRVLSDKELQDLLMLTHNLGMQALVEVHSDDEMSRALDVGAPIIGVNNRNLQTFEVDFANIARLRDRVPPETVIVAESGIKNDEDVRLMGKIGVDAVLVGESLVRSKDTYSTVKKLVAAGRP
jgi:indole-3-glycerol phosphate synthase